MSFSYTRTLQLYSSGYFHGPKQLGAYWRMLYQWFLYRQIPHDNIQWRSLIGWVNRWHNMVSTRQSHQQRWSVLVPGIEGDKNHPCNGWLSLWWHHSLGYCRVVEQQETFEWCAGRQGRTSYFWDESEAYEDALVWMGNISTQRDRVVIPTDWLSLVTRLKCGHVKEARVNNIHFRPCRYLVYNETPDQPAGVAEIMDPIQLHPWVTLETGCGRQSERIHLLEERGGPLAGCSLRTLI